MQTCSDFVLSPNTPHRATYSLHKMTGISRINQVVFIRSYAVSAVPTAWRTSVCTSGPTANTTCLVTCSPTLCLLQNCCSFLCAPEMLWIQPVRQHVDQVCNDLQFNDLFPYLPSHWAGRATRSKTHILLPWTYTGLEKQFIKFLKLEEGPAVGAGCRREAVKGWTFKTLGLVTADLNLCWTQSASEKHFHHKALFPPRFLNTSPYQFESCSLFLSQKEFPFKQKLFRHFQDMKC